MYMIFKGIFVLIKIKALLESWPCQLRDIPKL